MPEPQNARERDLQVIRLLTGAFFFFPFALAFALHQAVHGLGNPATLAAAATHPSAALFVAVSVAMAVMSFVLKSLFGPKGAGEWTPERRMAFFRSRVIALVLADSVGVYGFAFGVLSRSFEIGVPFFCASAVLLILHYER